MTTTADTAKAFIAPRLRALAILLLVAMQILLMGAQVAALAVGYGRIDGDAHRANEAFATANWLARIDTMVYLAAFIVFLTWVYRATKNLPALGSMSHRFSPGAAVWAYLIPFVNFVRGHQAMADIWRESQPAAIDERGACLPRNATLVHWWWGILLASRFFHAGSYGTLSPELMRDFIITRSLQISVGIAAAVLFMLVVRGAERRQEAQWHDLVLRQNVPQPTADALR